MSKHTLNLGEHHYLTADLHKCAESGVDRHSQELYLVPQSTLLRNEWLEWSPDESSVAL